MDELSDVQILRRLAEIEGAEWRAGAWCVPAEVYEGEQYYEMLNPIESKGQALELMEKHEVLTEVADGDGWHTMCDGAQACDKSLARAICLAIIRSHESTEAKDG